MRTRSHPPLNCACFLTPILAVAIEMTVMNSGYFHEWRDATTLPLVNFSPLIAMMLFLFFAAMFGWMAALLVLIVHYKSRFVRAAAISYLLGSGVNWAYNYLFIERIFG